MYAQTCMRPKLACLADTKVI